jgi:beta-N-acetylhexosaminidase
MHMKSYFNAVSHRMLMAWAYRLLWLGLLLCALVASTRPVTGQDPQPEETPTAADPAAQLLTEMSVAERVGQLFLVTFNGSELRPADGIVDLITNYHVGSVALLAQNDNIPGLGNTPAQIAELTNQLQGLALIGPSTIITSTVDNDALPPAATPQTPGTQLPLFIALSQEGDGPPHDQIIRGLTALPSAMAIGATWDPGHAEFVGTVTGRELANLGLNMLLGPVLDVVENPLPAGGSELGVRSFGGDPYWVSRLGAAYITGVHNGSNNRLAVVPKHFPGFGNSDRPLGAEIAAVRRSLPELQMVELVPFAAVTGRATDPASQADGLFTTHIRYQGFQNDIQSTSAPVSFDSQALTTLMTLPEFSSWRENGGLIVSDSLGSPAVQQYYDDTGTEFPHRRVARDALFAGNDLLFVADFALGGADPAAELANVQDTILWFQERYETDPSFQSRIDEAVLRILRLKLRIYNQEFSLDNVLVNVENANPNTDETTTFELAQDAVHVIAARPGGDQGRLPDPPEPDDNIVIFTDLVAARQCSSCPPTPYIALNALEEKILTLYGPEGSDQIQFDRILSFSFADLEDFLSVAPDAVPLPPTLTPSPLPPTSTITPEPPEINATPTLLPPTATPSTIEVVGTALEEADWILFAQLAAEETALNHFLADRPDLTGNKQVVVFAYHVPYLLDSTEVSKLAAYYAVYSKIDTFVDASVRALFQESPLTGAAPVDIPSIGYDLQTATSPDPAQIIDLFIDRDGTLSVPAGEAPLEVVVGDTLHLSTGVIIDRNGNPVPDGTLVQFVQQDRLEGFTSFIDERPTQDGVATLDYVLEARTGQFRITAAAGAAENSQQVDIIIGDNVQIVVVTLTPAPTNTSTPTPTPSPTNTPTPTSTPTPSPTAIPTVPEPAIRISLTDISMLIGVLMGLIVTAGVGALAGRSKGDIPPQRLLRTILWGLFGSLLAYNYYVLNLPGSELLSVFGNWTGLVTTFLGGMFAYLLVYLWQTLLPAEAP